MSNQPVASIITQTLSDPLKGASYYSEKNNLGQFITSPQIFDPNRSAGMVVERGITIPLTYNLTNLIFSIPITTSRPVPCSDVNLTENVNNWTYSINCLEDKQIIVEISRENEQVISCTTFARLPQGNYPMDTVQYQYPVSNKSSTTVPVSFKFIQFKPLNYTNKITSLDTIKSRASISTVQIIESDFNENKYADAINLSEAEGLPVVDHRAQDESNFVVYKYSRLATGDNIKKKFLVALICLVVFGAFAVGIYFRRR